MEVPPSNTTGLLKEIFLEALERTDFEERTAFVDTACGDDEALRQRVENLLTEQESVGSFLELPVWSSMDETTPGNTGRGSGPLPSTEQIGDYVGKYKLVKKLGEGGCGAVYVAQQEEPLRREVAVKVVRVGRHAHKVISRFEAERQTLAVMDHPNIASVYDAGTTQSGLPFFVMELIRGTKLTEHCTQHRLGIHERLNLFIQVCFGVQHAHQKGVIHRDLKPSNILVADHDGRAIPKIIDFGIATAIHNELPRDKPGTAGFTQLMGTPAYMSPEQAAVDGSEVDTRSDIYSLGLILHELLTGRRPPPGRGLLDRVIDPDLRATLEEQPAEPSRHVSNLPGLELTKVSQERRVTPAHLIKLLRGDLDCIVVKALEQDRSCRYATARALAEDIESYLAHEPVQARPATTLYRLWKLARRHETVFAALTGAAIVLLVAAGFSSWLEFRAREAETQAHFSGAMEAQLRREASRARERAQKEADLARLNEYVADINLAQESLNSGNYGRALQLLGKHQPVPHKADFRGFEWRYLWNLSRGDDHQSFPAQDSSIRVLTLSPQGRWLAIGTDNGLKLWDFSAQASIHCFPERILSAAFFPDDRRLAVTTPTQIRIVDLNNFAEITLLNQNGGALAITKDGSRLAATTRQGVRLWETKAWSEQNFLPGAAAPLAFSPDNTVLATAAREGITLWPVTNSGAPLVLKDSREVFRPRSWDQLGQAMTFSSDGHYLVAPRNFPSDRGLFVISTWDVQSGQEIAGPPRDPEYAEHSGTIAAMALSPDGHSLATASMDHSIRLWDLDSRRLLRVLHGHLSEVWTVAFAYDGATMFTGAKDGSVNIWAIPPKPKNDVLEGSYTPLAFSSDSRHLAALDDEQGTVLFLDPATKTIDEKLKVQPGLFRNPARIALSGDLKVLAAAHRNHISLYNTGSRERVEMEIGQAPIFELSLSPDGHQLVAGGFGGSFEWWDLSTHTNLVVGKELRRALFSPDGQTLLLQTGEQRAELWDVPTRRLRTVLTSESRLGPAAAFSPKGHLLAIGSDPLSPEQTISVWEVSTGHLLGACIGHKQGIFGLTFSADGRTLASTSSDSTLKLWNIATFQQLISFSTPGGARNPLFSPDGSLLVIGQALPQKGIRFCAAPLALETDSPTQAAASP
jgi:WD40 repeat protein/serine/threonine protein kinase